MKKNKKILIWSIITIIVIISFSFSGDEGNGQEIVMYKSPTCGCCSVYAKYLERKGYEVKIINEYDMDSVKNKFNIPSELESCHTMKINEYFAEGHIPVSAIDKMLKENPNIDGIGLSGMPIGSPGMPGRKTENFNIMSFIKGEVSDLFISI